MCPFGDRDTGARQTHSCDRREGWGRLGGGTKCMRKTQSSFLVHYIFSIVINNHRRLPASSSFSFSTSVWELMNNRNITKFIFQIIILKPVRTISLKIDAACCWPLSPFPASCNSLAVSMPKQGGQGLLTPLSNGNGILFLSVIAPLCRHHLYQRGKGKDER